MPASYVSGAGKFSHHTRLKSNPKILLLGGKLGKRLIQKLPNFPPTWEGGGGGELRKTMGTKEGGRGGAEWGGAGRSTWSSLS